MRVPRNNKSPKAPEPVDTPPFVSAILVAAGNATRMQMEQNKQLLPICGIPVLIRAAYAFQNSPDIQEIIIVTREEDLLNIYDMVKEFELSKVAHVVKGGATRQASVWAGVAMTHQQSAYFCIHDGARPLITCDLIYRCIADAYEKKAVVTGVSPKDTIKQLDADGRIRYTLDRNTLCIIQTPQVFEAALYRSAMQAAREQGADYSDDAQLIEALGFPVYCSPGSYANIKITTQEDIALAEALLMGQSQWFQT